MVRKTSRFPGFALGVLASSGLLALGSLGTFGCSGPQRLGQRPSLLDGDSRGPSYPTPATFRYHPSEIGDLQFAADLDGGSRLFLGQAGERWTVSANGRADASSVFAPERLVDAVSLRPGSWLFVGAGGGVYEATDAMGPFVRSGLPPRPLARVAVTREALLGVSFDGVVLRSLDFGQSWDQVRTEGRAVDIELLADGRGLLLTVPEKLFSTSDHGQTFDPVDVQPFGALALSRRGSDIEIDSALGPRTYTPGAPSPFGSSKPPEARRSVTPEPRQGPSADALTAGTAVISDDHYYELVSGENTFQLRSGPLAGPLSSREVSAFDSCGSVRLAARGKRLLIACGASDDGDVEFTFFLSDDGGKTFTDLGVRPRGSPDVVRVALLDRGFIVAGLCPLDSRGPMCPSVGFHLVLPSKKKANAYELSVSKSPGLVGAPLGVVANVDGSRIYGLGRRTKGRGLGVFVSTDHGKSFEAHEVSELPVEQGLSLSRVELGADGMLSAVVHVPTSRSEMLLTLDEQGRFVQLASAPVGDASLAGAGLLALAVGQTTGEVFESLNGGSEWQSVGHVPAASCTTEACVACAAQGCVIGTAVTRVGWEGQRETALASPGAAQSRPGVRAVGSTAMCRFDENAGWAALRADAVPGASSAAIGASSWFSFDADFKTGRLDFLEMPYGKPALRTQKLSAPSNSPSALSLYFTHQIEGVATLRQVEGQGIELAWVNLFEGPDARFARLPKDIRVRSRATRFPTKLAEPTALTIGRGSLYFAASEQKALVANGSTVRPLSFIDWPAEIRGGRDELLRAGDINVVVRFFDGARAIAWRSVEGPSQTKAITVGLPSPGDFSVDQEMTIAYSGDEPGLYVARFGQGTSEAQVMPFTSGASLLGPAVRVPTQLDLGSVPASCSERARKTTHRVVTSFEPGTRHAVVISDPAEPMPVLVTGDAVLHGSPDEACAVAFDAESVVGVSERVQALVFTDPDAASWAFRRAPDASNDDELEFRRMSCSFDPAAEVPEEVFAAEGTLR